MAVEKDKTHDEMSEEERRAAAAERMSSPARSMEIWDVNGMHIISMWGEPAEIELAGGRPNLVQGTDEPYSEFLARGRKAWQESLGEDI